MASYFESGFTVLKELAKEKQLENLKDIYDEKFRICETNKISTDRLVAAFSDCD